MCAAGVCACLGFGGRCNDVVIQHLHSEPAMANFTDKPANPAESDDPQRLAGDLASRHAGSNVVIASEKTGGHSGKVPRQPDHQCEHVLGDTLCVGTWGIDNLDAAGRCGFDVDLIVAHAVPAHDLELLAAIEQRAIDDPPGPNDERFGLDDFTLQGRCVQGAGHAQLGRIAQDLQPGFVHGRKRKENRACLPSESSLQSKGLEIQSRSGDYTMNHRQSGHGPHPLTEFRQAARP